MITTFALALLATSQPAPSPAPVAALPVPQEEGEQQGGGDQGGEEVDPRARFSEMRAAAEGDAAKLWEVHAFCMENALESEGRGVLRAIVQLQPEDEKARKLLGHVRHEDRWFESQSAVDRYEREKVAAEMRAKGLVEVNGEWVPEADAPFLRRGLIRLEDGTWVTPEEKRYREEGWGRQDLTWISPGELDLPETGLWKCGDDWFTIEEADLYHANVATRWQIPYEKWVLHTTNSRAYADAAAQWMDWAHARVVRAYGVGPKKPVAALIVRNLAQYNGLANGTPFTTEASGYSSIHSSYVAEAWFDNRTATFPRAAITYWDPSESFSNFWGPMRVRGAGALAMAEAIDPSPNAEATFVRNPTAQFPGPQFWSEKKVPMWFRFGVARYAECFAENEFAEEGGDPLEWRKWAIDEFIKKNGGLDPLDRVFRFSVTPNDPAGSSKLVAEAGLIVAFVLDGGVQPVIDAHRAFKVAMRDGGDVRQASLGLQKAVQDHENELREFAGLPAAEAPGGEVAPTGAGSDMGGSTPPQDSGGSGAGR